MNSNNTDVELEKKHQNVTIQSIIDRTKGGGWNDERLPKLIQFIEQRAAHYAKKLGVSFDEVVDAWEKNRDYSAVNYYQNANFPEITADVLLMNSVDQFKEFCQGKGFICGSCGKNTKSPYECKCGWKTYGLFGPGKTATFIVLRPAMRGEWIFRPAALQREKGEGV